MKTRVVGLVLNVRKCAAHSKRECAAGGTAAWVVSTEQGRHVDAHNDTRGYRRHICRHVLDWLPRVMEVRTGRGVQPPNRRPWTLQCTGQHWPVAAVAALAGPAAAPKAAPAPTPTAALPHPSIQQPASATPAATAVNPVFQPRSLAVAARCETMSCCKSHTRASVIGLARVFRHVSTAEQDLTWPLRQHTISKTRAQKR